MVQEEQRSELIVSGRPGDRRPNVFARIALFVRQVFGELRKVVTPTRQELIKYTAVVLAFVVIMMGLVYGLDVLFVWLTQNVFGVPGGPVTVPQTG